MMSWSRLTLVTLALVLATGTPASGQERTVLADSPVRPTISTRLQVGPVVDDRPTAVGPLRAPLVERGLGTARSVGPDGEDQLRPRGWLTVDRIAVLVGGALVAGALTDYFAGSARLGLSGPQAGAFGTGAVLATLGGIRLAFGP